MLSEKTEKELSHNPLQGGMLGTRTEALSANVTTDKAIRPGVPKTAGNVFNGLCQNNKGADRPHRTIRGLAAGAGIASPLSHPKEQTWPESHSIDRDIW